MDQQMSIKKNEIEDRKASENSIMPLGLLNRLSREEILDLVAFVLDLVNVLIASGSNVRKAQAIQQRHKTGYVQVLGVSRCLQIIEELLKIGSSAFPCGVRAVT